MPAICPATVIVTPEGASKPPLPFRPTPRLAAKVPVAVNCRRPLPSRVRLPQVVYAPAKAAVRLLLIVMTVALVTAVMVEPSTTPVPVTNWPTCIPVVEGTVMVA